VAKWTLEPGHTAAEFAVRHMMVTLVRGAFKNVEGTLDFDPQNPASLAVDVQIDAGNLWSGDADRDGHLKAQDFLDVEHHPSITFKGSTVELLGKHDFNLIGELTMRGTTRTVPLHVRFLGEWDTPFWEGGVDKGPKKRAGFVAKATINRHDFGVSWAAEMPSGGHVVAATVDITIDAEAILDS
jgi:polyisoprenoid-binding protein YceI